MVTPLTILLQLTLIMHQLFGKVSRNLLSGFIPKEVGQLEETDNGIEYRKSEEETDKLGVRSKFYIQGVYIAFDLVILLCFVCTWILSRNDINMMGFDKIMSIYSTTKK